MDKADAQLYNKAQRKYDTQGSNSRHIILSKLYTCHRLVHLHKRSQSHQTEGTHRIPQNSTSAARLLLRDDHLQQNAAKTDSNSHRPSIQIQDRVKPELPDCSVSGSTRRQRTFQYTYYNSTRLQKNSASHRSTLK